MERTGRQSCLAMVVARAGAGAGQLGVDKGEGADRRLAQGDPGEAGVGELRRPHFAADHAVAGIERRQIGKAGARHRPYARVGSQKTMSGKT